MILSQLHHFLLGPLSWLYLHGWISSETWVSLNETWFAVTNEIILDGHGWLHGLLLAWQLAWEAV